MRIFGIQYINVYSIQTIRVEALFTLYAQHLLVTIFFTHCICIDSFLFNAVMGAFFRCHWFRFTSTMYELSNFSMKNTSKFEMHEFERASNRLNDIFGIYFKICSAICVGSFAKIVIYFIVFVQHGANMSNVYQYGIEMLH